MSRAAKPQAGKTALDLLEQATQLVRTAPISVLALYYLGALPFVLGGLYFWADMSRSPYAYQHLAGATLGMAALFLWMKFWQVIFARQVRALICGQTLPPLTLRRCGHILVAQAALQPTGLFVLPLASIPMLPAGWAYAFYQNLTALDDGETIELLPLFRKARRQATLWPGQNHVLLTVLLGFGFGVLCNWGAVCYLLPGLLKMCLGVESAFTRSNLGMLNTTFFATLFALTYLSVDPILKAAYALRCFYGESVQSGEDLKAELRGFLAPGRAVALCVLAALAVMGTSQGANMSLAARTSAQALSLVELSAGGTADNSPAFQRWVGKLGALSPEGTAEVQRALSRPFGTRPVLLPLPALKRWPTLGCPSGTGHQCVALRFEPGGEGRVRGNPAFDPGLMVEAVGSATPGPETSLKRGANESGPGGTAPSISAPKLDRAIEEVIQGSKYTWRAPRENLLEPDTAQRGIIGRFLDRMWDLTKRTLKSVFQGLGRFFEWLGKWLDKLFGRFFRMPSSSTPGYGWIMSLNLLLYLLVAAVVLGFLYLGYRIWRNRRPREQVIASEAIRPLPDVADENVGADQLPEDGWVKLARELLARGELRLALRAFYLASLAHLAERNLLSIARFKSNRDYQRELVRRGHSFPELLAAFGENVAVFERIWYGLHEVSLELVHEFAGKVERMKGGSEGQRS